MKCNRAVLDLLDSRKCNKNTFLNGRVLNGWRNKNMIH